MTIEPEMDENGQPICEHVGCESNSGMFAVSGAPGPEPKHHCCGEHGCTPA